MRSSKARPGHGFASFLRRRRRLGPASLHRVGSDFGAGPHYCLGVNLARAELEEALAFLAPRMPGLAIDGDPELEAVHGIYGVARLPLRWYLARLGATPATADRLARSATIDEARTLLRGVGLPSAWTADVAAAAA